MRIGDNIAARLRLAGYRVCSACQEVLDGMESRGTDWTAAHKKQLARMLRSNLRKTQGRVPHDMRLRWIERQITLAIRIHDKHERNKGR